MMRIKNLMNFSTSDGNLGRPSTAASPRRWAEGCTGYPFVDAAMTELKDWAEAAEAIWALIYGESMIFFRPMGPHVWNSSSTYWGTHLGDQLSSRLQGRVLKLALQNHKEPPNSQTSPPGFVPFFFGQVK